MRVVRFLHGDQEHFGALDGDAVRVFDGNPLEGAELGAVVVALADCKLLAPVVPSKAICIGMNYAAHAAEISQAVPDEPLMFFKPISAIIGSGEQIVLPHQSNKVELEAERLEHPDSAVPQADVVTTATASADPQDQIDQLRAQVAQLARRFEEQA